MIKKEIRSYIKNNLKKYDTDNKYHDRFLDACIEKVLAEMYNEVWTADPMALQRFCKRYGTTTPVAVLQDLNAGIYYSNYPARFLPFLDKASGCRRVTTKSQGGMTFFPMDQREVELVQSGSSLHTVNSKIGYIVTPERLEYYDMTAAIALVGVRLDLIVPFSVYGETDDVLIPEFSNKNGETFLDRVLKNLVNIPTPDVVDDNTTTQTQEAK